MAGDVRVPRGLRLPTDHWGLTVSVVSSLLRHLSVMTSEALAPAGTQGGSGRPEGDGELEGGLAGGRCPRSGHQHRPDVVGREGIAEFQGFPSDMSTVRLLMSAVWTPGRSRARVRGPCGGSEHPGPGCPLLAPVQGPAGALVQRRLRREFSSGRPAARGWGATGQGLSVLHEPPHLMEYPRILPSSPRPSCSTRQGPPK